MWQFTFGGKSQTLSAVNPLQLPNLKFSLGKRRQRGNLIVLSTTLRKEVVEILVSVSSHKTQLMIQEKMVSSYARGGLSWTFGRTSLPKGFSVQGSGGVAMPGCV